MPTTTREHDLNESEQEILARAKKERLRLWVRKCTRMFDVGEGAMSYRQKYGIACPHSSPTGEYWRDYLYGGQMSSCEEFSNGKCKARGTLCDFYGGERCNVPFPYRRVCDAGRDICILVSTTNKDNQAAFKELSDVLDCPKMYSTGQPAFVDALRNHHA